MKVVLTKKLAEAINGIDLRTFRVGEAADLPARDAELLIAEEWAVGDRRVSELAFEGADRRNSMEHRRSKARQREHES